MKTAPEFSIVTPSFNQGAFIEDNIKSVLGQGYPDFEHIVIDGGSTDGTLDVLRRYPHLSWVSEPDRGQSHALNKGFSRARGDIIGWLNADDFYAPGAFEKAADLFNENHDAGLVHGEVRVVDAGGNITKSRLKAGPCNPEDGYGDSRKFLYANPIAQPAAFFRRSVIENTGPLDERLNYVMDVDYWVRIHRKFRSFYTSEVLANFRMHGQSKTGVTGGLGFALETLFLWHKTFGERPPPAFLGFQMGRQHKTTGIRAASWTRPFLQGLEKRFGLKLRYGLRDTLESLATASLIMARHYQVKRNRFQCFKYLTIAATLGLPRPSVTIEALSEIKRGVLHRIRRPAGFIANQSPFL
jgi:hypothetical protein